MLNVSQRIAPDTDHVVDVLLPKSLIRVGNRVIALRVVVGTGRHVAGNGTVIHHVAGPQLRWKNVRARLNPRQNGLVVDPVVAGRIEPDTAAIPERQIAADRRRPAAIQEIQLAPVPARGTAAPGRKRGRVASGWRDIARFGGPDEKGLAPIARSLRVTVERGIFFRRRRIAPTQNARSQRMLGSCRH